MKIAIDVGGTKISAALVDGTQIIEYKKTKSCVHTNIGALSDILFDLCETWLEQADSVAIACTGLVGKETVNFLSIKTELPLKQNIERTFGLPVTIINDAAAAAWAEYQARKTNKSLKTLVYLTVSTGVGGGIVQNGQLVTSNDGFCAHVGHTSVHSADAIHYLCHCGRINCIEAIASGTAIAKHASAVLCKPVTCKQVFELYFKHPEISKIIENSASSLVDLIANIKAITGAEEIVIGGSVGSSPELFNLVKDKFEQLPNIYQTNVSLAMCGPHADLIGVSLYSQLYKS
ncbi:MAG: ROK family protein [Thalassotalea sp.]|nr:ROK family protein [Thalassotalea sp.]